MSSVDYYTKQEEEYLAHHGILGMKWGRRRFQNKDGSLTAEGRKRYSEMSDDERSEAKSKAITTANLKEIKENFEFFTNEEIAAAFNRDTLNKKLDELTYVPEVSKFDKVKKVLDKVVPVAEQAAKIADNFSKINKSLNPSSNNNNQNNNGKDKNNNNNNNNQNSNKNAKTEYETEKLKFDKQRYRDSRADKRREEMKAFLKDRAERAEERRKDQLREAEIRLEERARTEEQKKASRERAAEIFAKSVDKLTDTFANSNNKSSAAKKNPSISDIAHWVNPEATETSVSDISSNYDWLKNWDY